MCRCCGDGHEFRRLDYREMFAASLGDLDSDNKTQLNCMLWKMYCQALVQVRVPVLNFAVLVSIFSFSSSNKKEGRIMEGKQAVFGKRCLECNL